MRSNDWFEIGSPARRVGKRVRSLLRSLAVPLVAAGLAGAAQAQTAHKFASIQDHAAPPACVVIEVTFTLPESLHLALQRHPRLAAQQASLASAQDASRALDALKIPTLLDRELPVRRQQAALGVTAASAGLERVEQDTVYAVTRTWFTVLYAREQERVARGVVDRLSATYDAAQKQLKAGARDVTATDVNRTLVYLRLAETRQVQAAEGVQRALVALREAIGLGPEVRVDVPAGPLPEPQARPDRTEVVAQAQARRGDLVQANTFADIVCLEVDAQATSLLKRMETFAAGADIHSRPVPQEMYNNEYRPGAVAPEMPTLLAGSRHERMKRARDLHARAVAVVDVTRNLIVLEAEDAFLRWEEASREVPKAREAAETGAKLADDLSKDFAAGLRVRVEEVVNARVLASQARAQYNEFLYREILALADLERVTAGGFCAGLIGPAIARPQQVQGSGGK
ncbi:MAG: TolC family protein [Planctomycetes bacterium]|nr:TolC family protein [Planctomycetota bacterium]